MAGYVAPVPAFVCANSQAEQRAVSVIFENLPVVISLHFSPFWLRKTFVFLDVLNKDNYS